MNRIINLRHAISARVGWLNNFNHLWDSEYPPEFPTFLGSRAHEKRPSSHYDSWRFFVTFEFGSRVTKTFEGSRARGLWKEWKARQFSKTTTNTKRKKKNGNSTPSTSHTDTQQLALI